MSNASMPTQAIALAFIALITLSSMGTVAVDAAPSEQARGMVGVPDANINDNVPQHARDNMPDSNRFKGNVMTDKHAQSLQATITTQERANGNQKAQNAQKSNSPKFALELTDDTNHDGRQVAVPEQAVADAVGYVPSVAYIEHESGDTYQVPVEEQGDTLVFSVKHFSTNTVTFDGSVSLSGTDVENGTQYTYDVSDVDSVSDFNISVTGQLSTETDTEMANGVGLSSSNPISIAGTQNPTNEQIEVTANPVRTQTEHGSQDSDLGYVSDSSAGIEQWVYDSEIDSSTISGIDIDEVDASSGDVYVDVYIVEGKDLDGTLNDGTKVADNVNLAANSGLVNFDSTYSYSGSNGISVNIDYESGSGSRFAKQYYHGDGNTLNRVGIGTYQKDIGMDLLDTPQSVSVAPNDGSSVSIGDMDAGVTYTKNIDYTTVTSSIDFSGSGSGSIDYTTSYKEYGETVDPTIEVNGQTTGYTGTLSEGQTETLTTDSSWVKSGTNTVNVSLGSASADAPTPTVDYTYSHDAKDTQTVEYSAEQWSESYNISKTYSDANQDTSVTIPFSSDRVVSLGNVEKRVNGGSWQSVSDSDYTMDGTTLTVQTGDVSSGDTIDVRTDGRKVNVKGGSITVTEASPIEEYLDSKIRVDSVTGDLRIEVGNTTQGNRLHYIYNEQWDNPSEYSYIEAGGSQTLYMPNAESGLTSRVTTAPVMVEPHKGDVEVSLESTESPFKFNIKSRSSINDPVDYTYLNAQDDTDYILWSDTNGIVRDSGTANSPLTLTDDDSGEILVFQIDDSPSGSSDSDSGGSFIGGGGGPISVPTSTDPLNSPIVLMGGATTLIAGLVLFQRRVLGDSGTSIAGYDLPVSPLLGVAVLVIGIATLDYVGGGSITAGLGQGIGATLTKVGPALGIGFGGFALYYLYKRFIKGRDTTIKVIGRRGGK